MAVEINARNLPVYFSFFWFYAAVASMMPFHILYMMASGVTPSEQGVITGLTPLIASLSGPLVSALADKYKAHKLAISLNLVLTAVCFSLFMAVPVAEQPSTNPSLCNLSTPSNSSLLVGFSNLSSVSVEYLNDSATNCSSSAPTQTKLRSVSFEISGSVQFWMFLILRVAAYVFFLPASALSNAMVLTAVHGDPEMFSASRAAGSFGFLVWVLVLSVINQFVKPPAFLAHASNQNFLASVVVFDLSMVFSMICFCMFDMSPKTSDIEAKNGDVDCEQTILELQTENKRLYEEKNDSKVQDDAVNSQPGMLKSMRVALSDLELCAMLLVVTVTGLLWTVHECYIFWYVDDIAPPPAIFWGIALAVSVCSEVPATFFSGKLIKRIGEVNCVLLALAAYIVRFVANGLISSAWPLVVTQVLHGITFGVNIVASTTFVGRLAPPGYSAAVQGMAITAYFGLGAAIGGFLGGVLWRPLGGSNVFFACAALAAITLAAYAAFHYYLVHRFHGKAADEGELEKLDSVRDFNENPTRTPVLSRQEEKSHA